MMEIRPLPRMAQQVLGYTGLVLTSPVWIPLIALMWLSIVPGEMWRKRFPLRAKWRFAWLPVRCDPWPHDGFTGTIWLERAWWDPRPEGFSHWRREAPEVTA